MDIAEPPAEDVVTQLRRWQDSGAIWRVVRRDSSRVVIALITCTGDEEVARLTSTDPVVLAFVGTRTGSEDR